MLSVSIGRSSLGKAPLVFTSDPTTGLWIPEDGLGRPAKRKRRRYAGSDLLNGSTLTGSSKEQSTLPATLYVQDNSMLALEALMDEVEEALDQFTFLTTVTINSGGPRVWRCDDSDYDWGDVDSGMTRAFMARATVSIPVYPIPGV